MFRRETIVFNYKEILEANPDLPYICATNRALIYTSGVFNVIILQCLNILQCKVSLFQILGQRKLQWTNFVPKSIS
jgi:hypothetical protein